MTQNRRPGFRLPWTSDEEGTSTSAPATADASASDADADVPTADVPGNETAAPTATNGTSPPEGTEEAADTADTPSSGGEPVTAAADGSAEASDAPVAEAPVETDFMRDLVAAMRGVADEARRSASSEVQARADDQMRQLQADAERRRAELESRAEADVAGVGEWAAAEAERIRVEAEQRVAARRAQLEEQLAAESNRSEAATRAVRERLAEYERELDAFYAQLSQIADPAAFAAAAKRMPQPPSFEVEVEVEAAAVSAAPAASPAQPEASPPPDVAPAAEAPAAGESSDDAAASASDVNADDTRSAAAPDPGATALDASDPAAPDAGAIPAAMAELMPESDQNGSEPAVEATASEPGSLAERLATLRAEARGDAAPSADAAPAGESATTEVVVRGLGSFGAITGFRQALANVDGIDGVSLSLGQSGEFVFRATHAPGFDVAGAIVGLEGDSARVEPTPAGGLHVTLERAR